jgi:hypothetical protein
MFKTVRTRAALAVGLALIAFALPRQVAAIQAFKNGLMIVQTCTTQTPSSKIAAFRAADCLGYIEGVVDQANSEGLLSCMPHGMTAPQLELIVLTDLNAHPGNLHFAAPGLIIDAVAAAFSCRR